MLNVFNLFCTFSCVQDEGIYALSVTSIFLVFQLGANILMLIMVGHMIELSLEHI